MDIEQKPFACKMVGCGMSFTNDDHLNVHRKKHDMILNLSHTTGNKNSNNFIGKSCRLTQIFSRYVDVILCVLLFSRPNTNSDKIDTKLR